ncbi:MAG: hypothetical protein K9M82_04325 [Deltaproteobacteria bacterium]|nr:hypothetical protein [Deltaproteobacteria bacterium]
MNVSLPLLDFLAALSVALIVGGLFVLLTRRSGPVNGLLWLFLLILLATWAGGIWLRPFGPVVLGVHWFVFIVSGVVVVLLLSVSRVYRHYSGPRGRHDTLDMLEEMEKDRARKRAAYLSLGVLFWFLLAVLVTVILLRYLL